MARVAILIDEKELREQVTLAESAHTFVNETALFKYLCSTPWSKTIKDANGRSRELTQALLYLRVKAFNIELKTVKGKKGNPNIGVRLTTEEREVRIKDRPHYLSAVQHVRTNLINHFKAKARYAGKAYEGLPPAIERLLGKYAKGNVRAAVKLKCLECMCGEASEAARCQIFGCPLYLLNPFLRVGVDPETIVTEDEGDKEYEV